MMRRAAILAALLAMCASVRASGPMALLSIMDSAGGGGWTPAGSATHWFDYEHVTMSNDLVAAMLDQSGNSRHAYALGATSTWPRVDSGGIDFVNGANNALATASNLPAYSSGLCVVAVCAFDSGGQNNNGRIFEVPVSKALLFAHTSGLRTTWNSTQYFNASYNFSDGNTNIVSVLISSDTNAAPSTVWTNGAYAAAAVGKLSLASIQNERIIFGNNETLTRDFDGRIVEVVIFDGTNDAKKAEGYVAHKRGLAALLPAAHPYKESAP